MVNISELLINVVTCDKPKMLTGLSQNGKGSGMDAPNSSIADDAPPAERQNPSLHSGQALTHTGTGTERGKPVGSLGFARESEPQGTLMGLRVWMVEKAQAGRIPPGGSSRENLMNC
jgi:hypothetical protein